MTAVMIKMPINSPIIMKKKFGFTFSEKADSLSITIDRLLNKIPVFV